MKVFAAYMKENKLGTFTLALSLTFMFVGLPAQIYTIWANQSVRDVSFPMICLLVSQSFFWVLYGIQRKDPFMIIANSFGTFFAGVILTQCFLYW